MNQCPWYISFHFRKKHLTPPSLDGSLIQGASQHMTPHKHFFYSYKPVLGCKLFMSDNNMVEAVGKGFKQVETHVKGCARSITMHDVFHVPKMHSNLLSVSKLTSKGLKLYFSLLGCMVKASNGQMLAVALLEPNLYHFETNMMNGAKMNYLAYSDGNLHFLEL